MNLLMQDQIHRVLRSQMDVWPALPLLHTRSDTSLSFICLSHNPIKWLSQDQHYMVLSAETACSAQIYSWYYTKLTILQPSHATIEKLTYLAVAVAAGSVLLGAEGPAGGVAWSALSAHLGLQQTQLHQHCAVQAQAHLVCPDWPGGRLDGRQDANCSGLCPASLVLSTHFCFVPKTFFS